MFAMLHGPWPGGAVPGAATPGAGAIIEARVRDAVRAQRDAGLDLVTDGLVRWPDPREALREALATGDTGDDGLLVRSWRSTAGVPEAEGATVAAVLTGPWTLAESGGRPADAVVMASRLAGELAALARAGCRLAVVDEPAAVAIGGDAAARRRFREAQLALLADAPGLHAMLAITGGSAWEAGAETILEAPWSSHLFDLVAGPDNWYLVRATPGERGIVCGALMAAARDDQAPLLVWAARYAASMNGRGIDRVGLTNAAGLDGLSGEEAARAAGQLARAARFAAMEPEDAVAAGLDVRTFRQPAGRGGRRGGLPRA